MNTMDKLGKIRDRMDDMMIEEQAPREEEKPCFLITCNCCRPWIKISTQQRKVNILISKLLEGKIGKDELIRLQKDLKESIK